MKWLCLEAKALTPIALPQRAQAGNLYETLPEIPGTAVRGAFAARYIQKHGAPQTCNAAFEKLFENPNVRFGPMRPIPSKSLPAHLAGTPIFPVPRSARSCKYDPGFSDEHGVFDGLLRQSEEDDESPNPELRKCPVCRAPLEPLDSQWLIARWKSGLDSGSALDYDATIHLNTHVGIGPANTDDANLSEEGRLFSLQHLPAGTKFHGWIAIDAEGIDASTLGFEGGTADAVEGGEISLRVGRRSKSYGALNVRILAQSVAPPWHGSHGTLVKRFEKFQSEAKVENDGWIFSVTCLTDTILLDDFLRPCRAITPFQIARWLDLEDPLTVSKSKQVKRFRPLTGTRLLSGWNAAHKLPKENDCAIVAGSVFLFDMSQSLLSKDDLLRKLAKLEEGGVVWRRSEGFGQMLICDPFHLQQEKRKFKRIDGSQIVHRQAVKLEKVADVPEVASSELDVNELDSEVLEFLDRNADTLHRARGKLTRTQLNGLRDRVQRYEREAQIETDQDAKQLLRRHLNAIKSKNGCWEVVKVNGDQALADGVAELLELNVNTTWDTVRRRADDFVKGALIITTTKESKPPKLKEILATVEVKNE